MKQVTKAFLSLLVFGFTVLTVKVPAAFAGNSGGGTATIVCGGTNTPLDALAISFTGIPGNKQFSAMLDWYAQTLPKFADQLRRVTDDRFFRWSWIPTSCQIKVDKVRPDVPFVANYGVYYDGIEGMIVEAAYPTQSKLQLVAITHEAVRRGFCSYNESCTRFLTEAILAKYKSSPNIEKSDLAFYLTDSIRTAVRTSSLAPMRDGFTYTLNPMDFNEETISLHDLLDVF